MYSVEDEVVRPYGKAVNKAETAIRKQLSKWAIGGQEDENRFLLDHLLNSSINQLKGFTDLEANKVVRGEDPDKKYSTEFLDKILVGINNKKAIQEDIPGESLEKIAQTLPRGYGKADESYTIAINGRERTMTAHEWTNILIKHLVKIGAEAEKEKLGKFSQGTKIDTGYSR